MKYERRMKEKETRVSKDVKLKRKKETRSHNERVTTLIIVMSLNSFEIENLNVAIHVEDTKTEMPTRILCNL